jgi:hypothetical protein
MRLPCSVQKTVGAGAGPEARRRSSHRASCAMVCSSTPTGAVIVALAVAHRERIRLQLDIAQLEH